MLLLLLVVLGVAAVLACAAVLAAAVAGSVVPAAVGAALLAVAVVVTSSSSPALLVVSSSAVSAAIAAVTSSSSSSFSATASAARAAFFELVVRGFDRVEELDTHDFCALHFGRVRSTSDKPFISLFPHLKVINEDVRHMQVHGLIALMSRIVLHKPTTAALDLHPTARLALDVLDVAAARTDDLGAEIEAGDGLEVDGDAFLGPLATALRVAFDLRGLVSATEAALVDEVGEFLLHELVDFLDGLFEAVLGGAGDVEVERRVLQASVT